MSIEEKTKIEEALSNAQIPELYINGYTIASSASDIVVILLRNGRPVQTLNVSFTLAKTLAIGLNDVVQNIEKKANMDIKTTHDIAKVLEESDNGN